MNEMRFREMSRQRDSKLWDESRFEDPNHGDDLRGSCPSCGCDEECYLIEEDGDTVCKCGELIKEGGNNG